MSDYHRIEKAMAYISEHFSRQPTLEEVLLMFISVRSIFSGYFVGGQGPRPSDSFRR